MRLSAGVTHSINGEAPLRAKATPLVMAFDHLLMLRLTVKRIWNHFGRPQVAYAAW